MADLPTRPSIREAGTPTTPPADRQFAFNVGVGKLKRAFLDKAGVDDPGYYTKYDDSPTEQQKNRDQGSYPTRDKIRDTMNPGYDQGVVDTPLIRGETGPTAKAKDI